MRTNSLSTPLVAVDAVVLDTETTGLDPRTARIVQIAAVGVRDAAIVDGDRFECLVKPGVAIPAASTLIHGISDADVADAARLKEISPELKRFIGSRLVVGHAIAYDLVVLELEHEWAGIEWQRPQSLCVRQLAEVAAPELGDYSLDRLCGWLGVENAARHTAMGDARATAEVFLALLPRLRAKGVRTLGEAMTACRKQGEAKTAATGDLPLDTASADTIQMPVLARLDSFPYRKRVRDVMNAPPVFVEASVRMAEVMSVLIDRKVSSVFVVGGVGGRGAHLQGGDSVGIITERDVLRCLNAMGADGLDAKAGEIASGKLETVSEAAFVYRAIGRMDRIGVRHLGVHDASGQIVGALTTRNLLRHRAQTAIILGDAIESSDTAEALAAAWGMIPEMVRHLVADDVDPTIIAEVVSAEIRAMTRRAAVLAERRLKEAGRGSAPVAYAVMVLGSGGRGESLLAADQDNAIVFQGGGEGGEADAYFEALGEEIAKTLDIAGIPLCKGGVMAKNRAWRMSVADWKGAIDGWVRRQRPEDLLNVDIFFDGVPVCGERALAAEIRDHAFKTGAGAADFMKLLSEGARQKVAAFNFLGGFRKDESGRIDLKRTGLFPIVSAARVLAIKHGIRASSTPERYQGLLQHGIGAPSDIERLIGAHRVIIGEMLEQQLADLDQGVPPSPRVEVGRLTRARQARLKDALGQVDIAIDLVSEGRL